MESKSPSNGTLVRLLGAGVAAALTMLGLQGGPALAETSTWGSPVDLSPAGQSSEPPPAITSSADGRKVVAIWSQSADNYVIQVATSSDGGFTWGSPVNVTLDEPGPYFYNPRIVASADGSKLTAVWSSESFTPSRTRVLMTSTSGDGGTTWSSATTLSPEGEMVSEKDLGVVANSDGTQLVATWRNKTTDKIQSSRSADGGATWSAPVDITPVSTNPADDSFNLAMSGDGSTVVQTWAGCLDACPGYSVWWSTTKDGGQTWSAPAEIPSSSGEQPVLTVSRDGKVINIAWVEPPYYQAVIAVSRSTDGGDTWSAPEEVSDDTKNIGAVPSLAASADGSKAYMTWYYTTGDAVFVRYSDGVWSKPERMNTVGDDSDYPRVVASTDGSMVTVGWTGGQYVRAVRMRSSSDSGATFGDQTIVSGDTYDADSGTMNMTAGNKGSRLAVAWGGRNDDYDLVTRVAGGTVPLPELVADPESLAFGDVQVGKTATREVKVTNPGTSDLSISDLTVGGADAAQFAVAGGTCPAGPVPVDGSCTVSVRLAPSSAGDKKADLVLTSNAGEHRVALSGTATSAPGPSPSPTPGPQEKQKPANAKGMPPKRIATNGLTVLTGRNARTNAGQRINTRVRVNAAAARAAGEVRYYRIIRGPQGKVSIRTYGYRGLKVILVQSAAAVDGYRAYAKRTVYVDGVRR